MPEPTTATPAADPQQPETPQPLSHQSAFEQLVAEHSQPAFIGGEKPTEEVEKENANIDRATDLLAERLGFKKKSKKEDKPAEGTDKTDTTAETKDDEDKPRKINVRKREPVQDVEQVAAVAATTAAKTVAQAFEHLKPTRETPSADPNADAEALLTNEEKDDYAVIKHMAATNEAYKDLPGQYLGQMRKIVDYQRKWEAANPGETFDPNNEEHNDFYDRVAPRYSQRDFEDAKIDMAVERRLAKVQGKSDQKAEKLEAEMAMKDAVPLINQSQVTAIRDVLTAVNPELDKLLKEKGPDAVVEADEVAADIVRAAMGNLTPFIEAARHIDEPSRRIKINEKNPQHVEYIEYLMAQEQAIANGPASGRIKDGKRFASRRDFAAMPADQRAKHWFLTVDDLIARRVAEEAELAKDAYKKENERIDKLLQKRGYTKAGGSNRGNEQQRQTTTPAAKNNGEVRSPESLGSATPGQPASKESAEHSQAMDSIVKVLFGH